MTFNRVAAAVTADWTMHHRCVTALLIRVGFGSGLNPATVARAVSNRIHPDGDGPCDLPLIGRYIGDLLADRGACQRCAETVLNVLDETPTNPHTDG